MKTPAKTLAEINESRRLESLILGEIGQGGAKSIDALLRRLDWYSSLERPDMKRIESRVLCAQAAEAIRKLR